MKRIVLLLVVFFIILQQATPAFSYGWGYRPTYDNTKPEIGFYEKIIDGQLAYYMDFTDEKVIYFTFDNGYEQGYTEETLNILKKHSVPATFFLTGHYVKSEPELVKRIVRDGHIIGNHSYYHPDFTTMTKDEITKELSLLEQAVSDITDQKQMLYVRPPKGTFNENTLKWTAELGYVHVFWSVAFKDWEKDAKRGWQHAYEKIMKQIHPGAIILLHTVSEDNLHALEKVIVDLKKQGYAFKSLDELMLKELVLKELLY